MDEITVFCTRESCPVRTCDRHWEQSLKVRVPRYRDFEGTLVCIKALDKKKKDIPVPTESQEQQALFEWADRLCFRYPELSLLHHIPNEGKRSKSTGAKMKREGMKSGVPDIHLPVARGRFHSLYIELKRRKGSTVTQSQSTWIQLLGKYGNAAYICYGWEEAAKVIEEYLELK